LKVETEDEEDNLLKVSDDESTLRLLILFSNRPY
jgi:hypothetical protein